MTQSRKRTAAPGSRPSFEKLSDLFQTAIQDISDLMLHVQNIIRKCMNSIAILNDLEQLPQDPLEDKERE